MLAYQYFDDAARQAEYSVKTQGSCGFLLEFKSI